jgi:hypothetical protein
MIFFEFITLGVSKNLKLVGFGSCASDRAQR